MSGSVFSRNGISLAALIVVCAAVFILAVPSIGNNIGDPNMIAYFNADEGGLMDIAWWYYSGQKRDTFQWEFDYGLEMRYLADAARAVSRWVDFTPGTFVLILRWLHLLSWIVALVALWYFVGYHFARGWQQTAAVLLLATRHSFAYFTANLKPEPLVLLIMIVGLHYCLKMVDDPSFKNLIIATCLASCAFTVKFAGAFLLAAIVAAMYLATFRSDRAIRRPAYPTIRFYWMLPAIAGCALIALPLLVLNYYVRKSTGTTWVGELGVWESLRQNRIGAYVIGAGLAGIAFSGALGILDRAKSGPVRPIMDRIREIGSYALLATSLFAAWTAVIGFRWFTRPGLFITTYAFLGTSGPVSESIQMIPQKGLFYAFFHNVIVQIGEFDAVMVALFAIYIGGELYRIMKKGAPGDDRGTILKRYVLVVFLVPAFGCIFSMMRMVAHHMLPFFVALSVLALQGAAMAISYCGKRRILRAAIASLAAALVIADVISSGYVTAKAAMHRWGQRYDVAYEIAEWWRRNLPKDAKIVAEEYTRSYVPSGHGDIILFRSYFRNRNDILRGLVMEHRPDYVYYNAGTRFEGEQMPSIDQIVPEFTFREVKAFDSSGRQYERTEGARYTVYQVIY